jgi:DNA-directed RNA polymerase specialized sigma24 family protein
MEIATDNGTRLRQFVEAEADSLLGTLRLYVVRAGLAGQERATLAAAELLNDVVVEALAHAGRFRPDGQPRAWLLGIAANLIKREQVARATRNRREPLAHDLVPGGGETTAEDEIFDRLAALSVADPARDLAASQEVDAILAHVSEGDAQVLRLAGIQIELQPSILSQPVGDHWRPAERVRGAIDTLVATLRGLGDAGIFFAIAVLPWLLVVGVVLYVAVRLIMKARLPK